jgi:hypothetical protein
MTVVLPAFSKERGLPLRLLLLVCLRWQISTCMVNTTDRQSKEALNCNAGMASGMCQTICCVQLTSKYW